jgi:hypothetical protein
MAACHDGCDIRCRTRAAGRADIGRVEQGVIGRRRDGSVEAELGIERAAEISGSTRMRQKIGRTSANSTAAAPRISRIQIEIRVLSIII